jgi:hypothetical protein
MDIAKLSGSPSVPQISLPGSGKTAPQIKETPKQDTPQVTSPETDAALAEAAEIRRYERVIQAAQAVVSDLYVVSDQKFSIYKDVSGQYITRYTSLRDGTVTYIPEPELLRRAERAQANLSAALEINV